jgi:hypothetical protein
MKTIQQNGIYRIIRMGQFTKQSPYNSHLAIVLEVRKFRAQITYLVQLLGEGLKLGQQQSSGLVLELVVEAENLTTVSDKEVHAMWVQFLSIANDRDWRSPIRATIDPLTKTELRTLRDAVRFFTGTEIEVQILKSGKYKITGDGYSRVVNELQKERQ